MRGAPPLLLFLCTVATGDLPTPLGFMGSRKKTTTINFALLRFVLFIRTFGSNLGADENCKKENSDVSPVRGSLRVTPDQLRQKLSTPNPAATNYVAWSGSYGTVELPHTKGSSVNTPWSKTRN